tara:strand:+ start:19495 stop:19878 length:384 start_codon:yes stop_codon:yes gene_type:complete
MKLMWVMLLTTFSRGFHLVGNTYVAKFQIPIILKKQDIQLYFVDKSKANLKLNGFINNEGIVDYNYNKNTKEFSYKPDENIKKIMNKYLLTLYDIYYNETFDIGSITIRSKLLRIKQKIDFNNVKKI